jgi:cytosine/adenosine deaminase-related metal-dependent hydrolase
MNTIYRASWVLPISAPPIANGAVLVKGDRIAAVGDAVSLIRQFADAPVRDFKEAAIIPGLINAHSHLELTAMRGFLENEENDFFAWLRKLTIARLEKMTPDDLYVSAAWGACEGARAGITCFADASDSAETSMKALRDVGLRGIVFQESFGPDPRLVDENVAKLVAKINVLRPLETALVKAGVSPHAPYTVCPPQLQSISRLAIDERLPLMMHAAETQMEVSFLRHGSGPFAEGLRKRGIAWEAPGVSTIQHLNDQGILQTRPLLAHCIHVDESDLEILKQTETAVAHCPKSNAKLRHGTAPFEKFLEMGIATGLGSDSVASNNVCDLLEESRFALLMARATAPEQASNASTLNATRALDSATRGGARAMRLEGQVGELREGLQADFAVVSLASAHQTPSSDPVETLIFSSSGRDVVLTVVAGREVFSEGRMTTIDEEDLKARIVRVSQKLKE